MKPLAKKCIGAVLAMFWAVPALAGNNGMQTVEAPIVGCAYIPCLGEYVDWNLIVDGRHHEFTTPGGGLHVVEKWLYDMKSSAYLV